MSITDRINRLSGAETGGVSSLAKALSGDADAQQRLAKSFAADDTDALSVDEPVSPFNLIQCPECGKVGTISQVKRHIQRTGHSETAPQPHYVPNENVAANPEGDYDEPMGKRMKLLKMAWEDAKKAGGKRVKGKRECTVCGEVVDETDDAMRTHSTLTNHASFAPYFK